MPSVFDPRVISRVKGYDLRSRRLAEGYTEGMHKSRLRGMSTSFAQHRQYVAGDDTRHLDWKVFAKTDRFYLKQYEAETNLTCRFVLDASKSMFFKSDEAAMSKFEYAATVVATLAYLLMSQKDTFGLVVFDQKIRTVMPPKSSGGHFRNVVDTLQKITPGAETQISDVLLALGGQLKRKGLVIIVSDFMTDLERLALGLGQLSFAGQDAHLICVEDPVERDLPYSGQTIFLGSENEGKLLCDPSDLRETYLQERAEHLNRIQDAGRKFGYALDVLATDAPLDAALASLLAMRLGQAGRS